MFKSGLSRMNNTVKANPPKMYVAIPPSTFTPGSI